MQAMRLTGNEACGTYARAAQNGSIWAAGPSPGRAVMLRLACLPIARDVRSVRIAWTAALTSPAESA